MSVKEEFQGIGMAVQLELGGRIDLHENLLAPYLPPAFIVVSTSRIKAMFSVRHCSMLPVIQASSFATSNKHLRLCQPALAALNDLPH
jgi:hypothetical protein